MGNNRLELHVPSFQRHYVWGQRRPGEKDSASFLTICLIESFRKDRDYFLQSITINDDRVLVDGQQRVTYLYLLLHILGYPLNIRITYAMRPDAQKWLGELRAGATHDYSEDPAEASQDIYFFKCTCRTVTDILQEQNVDKEKFLTYVLHRVTVLILNLPAHSSEVTLYKMMNGTKAQMNAADLIKADLMRNAADMRQPYASEWELDAMRVRYAHEWDTWVRWWCREDVERIYTSDTGQNIDLLLKLCMRPKDASPQEPVTYEEFFQYIARTGKERWHAAKHFFHKLRQAQHRIQQAFDDAATYNRIHAILLLQRKDQMYKFLHLYFIESEIDSQELVRYYKLSFLGMTTDEIYAKIPYDDKFDDLLASLSMADVYHTDTKRDVFNLLLRLNIDEDIKLGRKFDFSIWGNRSLEHIYSKSKVWHLDQEGKVRDGNDNLLRIPPKKIASDRQYMHRDIITNHDGTSLSEHCIGNLVLLYGDNNASFGNANFEQKKLMFLTPGDQTVFQSRNLLHSVCVFARNTWDHKSIVDNYNQIIKNLKIYYGYK